MINVYNFEDKTAEDCRMKCLEELDVYDDEIITREFEEDFLDGNLCRWSFS